MANGVPVVSTGIGAFGIEGKNQEHFYLADTNTAFFEAIQVLTRQNEKTSQLIKNAQVLIMEKYSQTKTSELRNKLYFEILANKA